MPTLPVCSAQRIYIIFLNEACARDVRYITSQCRQLSGADPGFVERGGAAATANAAGAKVFGGSRLKTLFGISKGGARPPCAPP